MKKEIYKKEETNEKRNLFAVFLLFFPTLILAGIPTMIDGSVVTSLILKMLIVFYQFIVVKNFVDKYYGD